MSAIRSGSPPSTGDGPPRCVPSPAKVQSSIARAAQQGRVLIAASLRGPEPLATWGCPVDFFARLFDASGFVPQAGLRRLVNRTDPAPQHLRRVDLAFVSRHPRRPDLLHPPPAGYALPVDLLAVRGLHHPLRHHPPDGSGPVLLALVPAGRPDQVGHRHRVGQHGHRPGADHAAGPGHAHAPRARARDRRARAGRGGAARERGAVPRHLRERRRRHRPQGRRRPLPPRQREVLRDRRLLPRRAAPADVSARSRTPTIWRPSSSGTPR